MEVESETQELHIHVNGEPERKPSTEQRCHNYSWRLRVSLYVILLLAGETIATLLGRLYYDKGGNSIWLETLVQLVGFPLTLPCYYYLKSDQPSKTNTLTNKTTTSFLKLSLVYIGLGLLAAGHSVLYSFGLLYLPVSTFSLISASQLAFNAVFSYFLNSQKFTPCILNSLVLLTTSSTLLVIQPESDQSSTSNSSSKYNYVIGYICAIGGSAGYSLVLSLTDYAFEKILKKYTFKAILDMVTYQSLVATCAVAVGLFVSGGWKMLRTEMEEFRLGKHSYLLINIGSMISWQACWIGSVGLILEVSSLFSNVISTLCLPVVPVLAVVFFRDEMSGIKLIAMFLAIWGFPRKIKVNAKQKVLFLRAVMERSQELNVNGDQNLEANLIAHEVTESSSVPQTKNYKKWLRISVYVLFVLTCQALSTILGRLYYENGGKSTWMVTVLQRIGFPVLKDRSKFNKLLFLHPLGLAYICLGLLASAVSYMCSVGLLYLPVSTFSLIFASQLAFTALFSYFLNSQKFTPPIVNSLFLLTVSSALLVFNNESQNIRNVSRVEYVLGFICTISASAGIGLLLSLVQLILTKVLKKPSFSAVMDMAIYQSLVSCCVVLIGLFASGEWRLLKSEMQNYRLGKVSYVMTLSSAAISSQVYTIGAVGLIFESSSVFSNTITAVGLPIVPVVAVIVFHDKMDALKIFSIVLAIWGFLSFVYQHYLDEKKLKTCHTNHVEEDAQA
ncbi:hypothetical protein Bca52824_089772 [Brassica carinata]|uniref:Uncharacterized protein n=1 Tax=Brassica carinata TaxID=52824 RepID=A0A8X7NTR8_BRACI|nr:hypothetical protein Bca52824_089772 [Brassica carinata]